MRIIHLHGASIGETKCLFRLYDELHSRDRFRETKFYLTYTSPSAKYWLTSLGERLHFTAHKLSRSSVVMLRRLLAEFPPSERGCIIAEKDRRPSVLRLHRTSRLLLNVEAKPPQSAKSRLFERCYRSIGKIKHFAVESSHYAGDIRRYCESADIRVTGTLKAPPTGSDWSDFTPPRLCFISSMGHEVEAVAQITRSVQSRLNVNCIIVPRYVTPSFWPWKDSERTFRRLLSSIPNSVLAPDLVSIERFLMRGSGRTAIFTGIGRVMEILSSASVAVVCGSLTQGRISKSKGHNFMEPMSLGIPTVVGPYHSNWRHSVADFVSEGSLVKCEDVNHVCDTVERLLVDPAKYQLVRASVLESEAMRFHQDSAGKITDYIEELCS